MISGFHKLTIKIADLGAALAEYQPLLGPFTAHQGGATLSLANLVIELVPATDIGSPQISALELWSPEAEITLPQDLRGLQLSVSRQRELSGEATSTGIAAVDHIVLRTNSADDCIRLFNKDLGMRLALDQSVPEWGGRMLFFRCGKLTLEVIQHLDQPVEQDYFWGITYLCPDLAATLALLDAAGVAHSEVRDGRKPGTLVATVKSHTLDIPTLLIQPASQ